MIVLRLTGNTFTVNSVANTIPTNASANVSFGATTLYLFNTGTANSTVTVSNSSGNVGSVVMVANTYIVLRKRPEELVVSSNVTSVICSPIAYYGD